MNEFDKTANALLVLSAITALFAAVALAFTGRPWSALVAVFCLFAAITLILRIADRARDDAYIRSARAGDQIVFSDAYQQTMDMAGTEIADDEPTFGHRITDPFRRRGNDAA